VSPLFVARMEDVLDLYAAPFDAARPVVCVDECPLALTAPTRAAIPAAPGRVRKEDYEYERGGSCSLFAAFQPLAGWRRVAARERRTAQDFAHFLHDVVDDPQFAEAEVIRLVLDNLNTHTPAALYETFAPAEARRIAAKLAWHYTPAHGSWLNMIEIEWSVLDQQCLRGRRLGTIATVQAEVDAWVATRNRQRATVQWRFTTTQARTVLDHRYPPVPPPALDAAAQPAAPVRTAA
jgi:hypothetical protein